MGVIYFPWVYYNFRGCTIPSMGVLYLPLCIFLPLKGPKSHENYDFLTPGGPIYLPINYRNFAHSPFKSYTYFYFIILKPNNNLQADRKNGSYWYVYVFQLCTYFTTPDSCLGPVAHHMVSKKIIFLNILIFQYLRWHFW